MRVLSVGGQEEPPRGPAGPEPLVALVNEGTYPFHAGGVSVWCDQLIRGLPDVEFLVVAICLNHRELPVRELPPNARLVSIPVWDQVLESAEPRVGRRHRLPALRSLARLLTAEPAEVDESEEFLSLICELVDAADHGALAPALAFPLLCEVFADALAASPWLQATHHGSMLDVARLAENFIHILRPLLFDLGPLDVVHLSSSGLPSLVGMSMWHRRRTPLVVTEHGLFLRERYLDLGRAGGRPAETQVMLRFYHLMVAGIYRAASVIAPVSGYNQQWQERVGAAPANIRLIHSAVEPSDFPVRLNEPERPSVGWLGRIDPIKDLHTLIKAAAVIRDEVPDVLVNLYGSAAPAQQGYLRSCHDLVDSLDLQEVVRFAGAVPSPADAFHTNQISALSSISEGFPYVVLESMACGVPVVGTDVGGVREAIGDAGRCVRANDPQALGAACLELLGDPALRRSLGRVGRQRVENMFDLETMLATHRGLYAELAGPFRSISIQTPGQTIDLREPAADEVPTP